MGALHRTLAIAGLALVAASANAKNMALPDNVTLRSSGSMSGDYLDTLSLEARGAAFPRLKLCLAQNVSNASVTLTGGTDAPFTFDSNHRTETTAVQGGPVFKYEDAESATVIAVGNVDGGPSFMGLSREVVRFELLAVATPDRTALKFSNIDRATLNSGGGLANMGFIPVGAWKGAKPLQVIDALQTLGKRIDACLQ